MRASDMAKGLSISRSVDVSRDDGHFFTIKTVGRFCGSPFMSRETRRSDIEPPVTAFSRDRDRLFGRMR